ncbi:recombinase family protein [Shigella sonnei]|nr:recombinase family protein [Shigella sonnei]
MKKVGYIRVSTTHQNTDRQLADIRDELDYVFEDICSGKNFERPQFKKMMELNWKEGDELHIHSMDRLGRNLREVIDVIENLSARGVVVISKKDGRLDTHSATGRLVINILASVAQMEREQMLERQREGYEARKANGGIPARGKSKRIDRDGIIGKLNEGYSPTVIAKEFNVGRATVYRIKEEAEKCSE